MDVDMGFRYGLPWARIRKIESHPDDEKLTKTDNSGRPLPHHPVLTEDFVSNFSYAENDDVSARILNSAYQMLHGRGGTTISGLMLSDNVLNNGGLRLFGDRTSQNKANQKLDQLVLDFKSSMFY